MDIPIVRGRSLTDRDTPLSPPVVVINQTMALCFFPDEDPIGKRLDISGPTYLREIVGIVGDVRQISGCSWPRWKARHQRRDLSVEHVANLPSECF
jgi:hypothetical protein